MALKPRNPWHPTAFYRPRGKKAEALPQSLPSTPAPRAQTEGTPGAPPQRARLPEAMEPPSREASLLHSVNNQISQDGELRTDSWSVTSTYTYGPRRLPRDRWDATGPGTARAHSKPHLLSASLIPEPREGREQQTGCVMQQVGSDLWTMRVLSAFLPGSRPHGKVGRQEQFPSAIWGSA